MPGSLFGFGRLFVSNMRGVRKKLVHVEKDGSRATSRATGWIQTRDIAVTWHLTKKLQDGDSCKHYDASGIVQTIQSMYQRVLKYSESDQCSPNDALIIYVLLPDANKSLVPFIQRVGLGCHIITYKPCMCLLHFVSTRPLHMGSDALFPSHLSCQNKDRHTERKKCTWWWYNDTKIHVPLRKKFQLLWSGALLPCQPILLLTLD